MHGKQVEGDLSDELSKLRQVHSQTCADYNAVESSYISHVGYLFSQEQLFVRMKSGRVYTYNHVAPELYWKFIHADSIGKFYNKYFKAGRRQP